MKYLWGFFRDTQLATFGWILLACFSVPLFGMYLFNDVWSLVILGLTAGVIIGLKTKVYCMLGAWGALSIGSVFFKLIVNEGLAKAIVVAVFMILSMSAVIFYKWFRNKGLTVMIVYFLLYCEAMDSINNRTLIGGPKEKTDKKSETFNDTQEEDDDGNGDDL